MPQRPSRKATIEPAPDAASTTEVPHPADASPDEDALPPGQDALLAGDGDEASDDDDLSQDAAQHGDESDLSFDDEAEDDDAVDTFREEPATAVAPSPTVASPVIVPESPAAVELAALALKVAALERDGDPLDLVPVLRLRIDDLKARQEAERETQRKKDTLAVLEARYDALLARGDPVLSARIDALTQERDAARRTAATLDEQIKTLTADARAAVLASPDAQALQAEIQSYRRVLGQVGRGRPARRPSSVVKDGASLHPRVWSAPMIQAADAAGLLPHDEAQATTLTQLFEAVESTGCLVPLLHSGQTFTRFTNLATTKGRLFVRACATAGLSIEVVDGSGPSGDGAARYWYRRTR